MIKNPSNIENDIVLAHGRWCLSQCMTEAGARALLTEDKVQPYAANEQRILSIMDRRRTDLEANRLEYCEGANILAA